MKKLKYSFGGPRLFRVIFYGIIDGDERSHVKYAMANELEDVPAVIRREYRDEDATMECIEELICNFASDIWAKESVEDGGKP